MFRRFNHIMTGILSSMKVDAPSFSSSGRAEFLLAVSGGVDSMTMATLFARFCAVTKGAGFAVAHCNFHLRGEESDGDCALVREWAASQGVVCHIADFDTVAYAKEHAVSIEMAARELRYSWFAELCRIHGYTALSVAHNANDNAETLFLNLLRGTGVTGLAGMSQVDVLPSSGPEVCMIRPLLQFTREQIEGYAFAEKIPYRTDRTNAELEYKRNRIRNQVFPLFEKINPSFVRTVSREMGYFTQIRNIADAWFAERAELVRREDGDGMKMDLEALMAQENWEYILFRCLEPYGFNSAQVGHIEHLLKSSAEDRRVTRSGKRFDSGSHILHTSSSELIVLKRKENADMTGSLTVSGPGEYCFNGHDIKVELIDWQDNMPLKQPQGSMIFDACRLGKQFVLRSWKHGDRLRPLGMRGEKKVSDIFTDLKFTKPQKESAIILETVLPSSPGSVAAILGIRQDERFKVTSSTCSVWRLSI